MEKKNDTPKHDVIPVPERKEVVIIRTDKDGKREETRIIHLPQTGNGKDK